MWIPFTIIHALVTSYETGLSQVVVVVHLFCRIFLCSISVLLMLVEEMRAPHVVSVLLEGVNATGHGMVTNAMSLFMHQ